MNTKWLIIIIIIVGMMMIVNPAKKETKFLFRCSEDKKTIEMYNKMNDKFDVWQDCGDGECILQNGSPLCTQGEIKKEEPDLKFNNISYLLIAAIIMLIIFRKKLWR